MSEHSVGIIGRGKVGRELRAQIKRNGHHLGLEKEPTFVGTSDGLLDADGRELGIQSVTDLKHSELPDAIFVATPTTDDGQPELDIIHHGLDGGAMVVTAAKGALVNDYGGSRDASNDFRDLGVNATVGAKAKLLRWGRLLIPVPDDVERVDMVPNGTIAAISADAAPLTGDLRDTNAAVARAIANGFAEPGSSDPGEVLRGEYVDALRKTLIFAKHVLRLEGFSIDDFQHLGMSDEMIKRALAERMRFIVQFTNLTSERPAQKVDHGFAIQLGNWAISGAFRPTDDIDPDLISSDGPINGISVHKASGVTTHSGIGAGPEPTAKVMLGDYLRIAHDRERTLTKDELDEHNRRTLAVAGFQLIWGISSVPGHPRDSEFSRKQIFRELGRRHTELFRHHHTVHIGPGLVPTEIGLWVPDLRNPNYLAQGDKLSVAGGQFDIGKTDEELHPYTLDLVA